MANTIMALRRTRVVLVEDSAPLRVALRAYLRHYADETAMVVGEAWGGWAAIREAALKRAEIIVLGLPLPDPDGWSLVRLMHLVVPKACIILAVGEAPDEVPHELKELGICMLLDRSRLITLLLPAIWECSSLRNPLESPPRAKPHQAKAQGGL